ncbi:TetR/AcrR family transcriptional regulator [Thalassotalea sp. HSM 43]|uniref:TetR/AcrR family transcriptional regulator n=1 Tax=Thalassotalea sp. HSM 43 TaxID=2552945 RepID=UPI0010808BD9|nr:TetR/AcrR family transcriptional regulator [Thalassotalea sp. HSM 43]QBY05597.1 TetR/AcrR family transcriptional regulator [Thalassotalea sp. HSM 43]
MTDVKSDTITMAQNILIAFSHSGFKKTSMQDIANAAAVSRQSIYKKFGSKERCYQWVIHTYLADMYVRVFAELDNKQQQAAETLFNVFNIFIGEPMQVVTNAHGTEVFDDCLKATHASKEDWPLRFRARLADFLVSQNMVGAQRSNGVAFTLISAGKGLMLERRSNEQFDHDLRLMIESISTEV